MKKPSMTGGLASVWCWNVCIPPAPVQTAFSSETALTSKSVNAAILTDAVHSKLIFRNIAASRTFVDSPK